MIKKLCSSITAAAILLLSTVSWAAEPMVLTPKIQFADLTVSVSGTIAGTEASYVTLQMFDMKKSVPPMYTGQTKAVIGADGKITFTFADFEIPSDTKTGDYIFRLGGNGLQTQEMIVRFANRLDKRDALSAINAASAQEMTQVIREHGENVDLDVAGYLPLAQTPQMLAMVNQALEALDLTVAEDLSDIAEVEQTLQNTFVRLVGTAQLLGGGSNIPWSQVAEKNKAHLQLDTEQYFQDLPQQDAVGEILKNQQFSTLDVTAAREAFDRAVMVCAVKQYDGGMGEEIFRYYESKEVISPDWSVYQRLSNSAKAEVWQKLRLLKIQDADSMLTNFKSVCSQLAVNRGGNAGGGGSSGGGSSRGGGGTGASFTGNPDLTVPENTTPSRPTAEFRDLTDAAWAQESIAYLVEQGILSGKEPGLFYPAESVTREEFIKMIVCAFQLSDDAAQANYEDVSPDAWYYPYVASGVKSGLIKGISPTMFGTGQTISRQDMAVIMARVCDLAQAAQERSAEAFHDEEQIADYAKDAVKRLHACGVINGVGNGRFAPEGAATRAEAAKIVYELVKLIGGVEHA